MPKNAQPSHEWELTEVTLAGGPVDGKRLQVVLVRYLYPQGLDLRRLPYTMAVIEGSMLHVIAGDGSWPQIVMDLYGLSQYNEAAIRTGSDESSKGIHDREKPVRCVLDAAVAAAVALSDALAQPEGE